MELLANDLMRKVGQLTAEIFYCKSNKVLMASFTVLGFAIEIDRRKYEKIRKRRIILYE